MSITRGGTITQKAVGTTATTNFNVTGHTTDAGTDLLMVGVIMVATTTPSVSTITWNGVSLSLVPGSTANQSGVVKILWYYLLAPTIQSASSVTVTLSGTTRGGCVALNYSGVDQVTPFGTVVTAVSGSNNTTPTVTASSAAGELVLALAACNNGDTTTATAGSGQTGLANFIGSAGAGANSGRILMSEEAGAASVVMDGTWSAARSWGTSAVPIKPAAGSPLSLAPTGSELLGQSGTGTYSGLYSAWVGLNVKWP